MNRNNVSVGLSTLVMKVFFHGRSWISPLIFRPRPAGNISKWLSLLKPASTMRGKSRLCRPVLLIPMLTGFGRVSSRSLTKRAKLPIIVLADDWARQKHRPDHPKDDWKRKVYKAFHRVCRAGFQPLLLMSVMSRYCTQAVNRPVPSSLRFSQRNWFTSWMIFFSHDNMTKRGALACPFPPILSLRNFLNIYGLLYALIHID